MFAAEIDTSIIGMCLCTVVIVNNSYILLQAVKCRRRSGESLVSVPCSNARRIAEALFVSFLSFRVSEKALQYPIVGGPLIAVVVVTTGLAWCSAIGLGRLEFMEQGVMSDGVCFQKWDEIKSFRWKENGKLELVVQFPYERRVVRVPPALREKVDDVLASHAVLDLTETKSGNGATTAA